MASAIPRIGALLACLACAAAFGAQAPDRPNPGRPNVERVALVIGNSHYKSSPLQNPVNDARAVAAALRQVGFTVTLREDAGLRDLIEAMREFSISASEAQVRLLYFAGHGMQVKGRNYLLPVDADIHAEGDVAARSADVNELLERLGQARQGVNIVILDACRNNPFTGSDVVLPDGRRLKLRAAHVKGLALMDAPLGTLVAFSTAPGGVALDSPGASTSLYTRYLVANLPTPGLPIEEVFKRVRAGVAQETNRVQIPWESSSLTGEFCFAADKDGSCGAR